MRCKLLEIDYFIEKCKLRWQLEAYKTCSLSNNSLKVKISLSFCRQWNSWNQPFSCRTDTSNIDAFSVHSKMFVINDICQVMALVSYIIGCIKTNLFQNLLKISWDSVRPTRSTLFSYCPVYLVIMICNQRKLISHKEQQMGCQFQDRKWTKTYRLRLKTVNYKLWFSSLSVLHDQTFPQ